MLRRRAKVAAGFKHNTARPIAAAQEGAARKEQTAHEIHCTARRSPGAAQPI